jgi:multidrug efflux system membrane fusion protein
VVQKTVLVKVSAVGAVEAYTTVSVRPQITGELIRIQFKEGQDVKKGDILFTIDPLPLEATLNQAEANLAKDMAQLQNAHEQARRYAELVKKQFVAQEQYDQIQTTANAFEAAVRANKAAVESAKVQLSYCTIRSPVDGRAGSFLVHAGNLVRINDATPLVVINQIHPIQVGFSLPEKYLLEIKKRIGGGSLKVEAIIPQNENDPEQGVVTFVDNAVDRTTGTIRLKGTFTNKENRLWPGQFVNVLLTLDKRPNAVVIPSRAVQVGQEGQYVFVVKANLTVEYRPVSVAQPQDGETVVEKGLEPGDKIVTDGFLRLAPGAKVAVKGEPTS